MTKTLAALAPLLAVAPFVSAEEPIRERIEWSDVWGSRCEYRRIALCQPPQIGHGNKRGKSRLTGVPGNLK